METLMHPIIAQKGNKAIINIDKVYVAFMKK